MGRRHFFGWTPGFQPVPENRTRPDSRTIELAYAIVQAAEEEGRPPTVSCTLC